MGADTLLHSILQLSLGTLGVGFPFRSVSDPARPFLCLIGRPAVLYVGEKGTLPAGRKEGYPNPALPKRY